jgi:DNA-binding transcriptional ArsR family regulator
MLSTPRAPLVEIEVAEAYELLMSLVAASDPGERGTFEIGRDWFERAEAAAGEALLADIARLSGASSWVFGNVLPLALTAEAPRDGAALRARLEALDDEELHLHLLGYYLRPFRRATPPEVTLAASRGDPAAVAEMRRTSFPGDARWPAAVAGLLGLGQAESAALLRRVVGEWHERVFRDEWAALHAVAERDAADKRALAGSLSPERLIDLATRGWEYVPEPGVARVVLAPSAVVRPWNVTADSGDTRIFCYAVGDEAVSATVGSPPPRLVRQLRALADERRLRVLRRLRESPASLAELAAEFGQPKTTMHHHLVALRAAGLVRIRDRRAQYAPNSRYEGRFETLPDVWQSLAEFLSVDAAAPGASPPAGAPVPRDPMRHRPRAAAARR